MPAKLYPVPDPARTRKGTHEKVRLASAGAVVPLHSPYQTYMDALAPITQRDTAYRLKVVAGMLWPGTVAEVAPWEELDAAALLNLRARLVERYRFDVAGLYLSAAKGCLRAAWQLGLASSDQWARAQAVGRPKGHALPAGHWIDDADWSHLFTTTAADTSPAGLRDLAILAVLRGSGCRRAELVALDLDDWQHASATLRFRITKGNRQRESACPAWVQGPMAAWLRVRGPMPGPLFLRIRGGGAVQYGERLTPGGLHQLWKKRAEAAGLGYLGLHDARRGYVSSALEAGIDPVAIARQVGHASVQTTMRYDRRPLAQLSELAQRMPNPLAQ
jgi:integrase/recombinase XerD